LQELREIARSLPETPGVYLWENEDGVVLYVGKAVSLRNRVLSYFSAMRRDRRVRDMVSKAHGIRHEVTPTELEALFRESALIKELKPYYNRALLISRPAHYLKLDRSRPDPVLQSARSSTDDGCEYFGPFRSAQTLRETIAYLHDVLPLRKCAAKKPRCKPCVYHQMNTCAAPALGGLFRERHEEALQKLFELLGGREDRVELWLKEKRDRLSESLLFERAAEIQTRIEVFRQARRRDAILEAAMQCRCVLVNHQPFEGQASRLLLVAHGHVVSTREIAAPDPNEVTLWLRAHQPVIRSLSSRQSEVDAALVFRRWVNTNRRRVKWVAIPSLDQADELKERVKYVLHKDTLADFAFG
jgi:excinuclease ABC subunit C